MNLTQKRLELVMAGGRVRRFHTVPTLADHNVGHHSFGVAHLLLLLTDGQVGKSLLVAALLHDVAEAQVGDVPAPTKRSSPEVKSTFDALEEKALKSAGMEMPFLLEAETRLLKLADCLDGMMNCVFERRLGNRNVRTAYWNFRSYVQALNPSGREALVTNTIVEMWLEADK